MTSPTLVLACAVTETYALGAAVTIRSALETTLPHADIRLYVLDGGLEEHTKELLQQSWIFPGVTVTFLKPDLDRVHHLKLTQGMQSIAYARLLLPDLLPQEDRVLYLDSDLLILADLTPLWQTDIGTAPLGAVRDFSSPTVSSKPALGLPRYAELGLAVDTPYVNSGVLLMPLDRWRKDSLGERVILFVEDHPEHIQWWDQDGINAVLAKDTFLLDPTWNVTVEGVRLLGGTFPDWSEEDLEEVTAHARIVHFLTRYKPWHAHCPHPKAAHWYAVLDRTAFAQWRPDPGTEMPYPPQPLS